MVLYSGPVSFIVTHAFIGVSLGTVLLLYARWRRCERPFQFGGEVFSYGLASRWLEWTLFALTFEVLSSCKSPSMYQEIALSWIEAPLVAAGAFLLDRACRWEEARSFIDERFKLKLRRTQRTSESSSKATKEFNESRGDSLRRFDDVTRGR